MSTWASLKIPPPRGDVTPETTATARARAARILSERGWGVSDPYQYSATSEGPLTMLAAMQESCRYDMDCYAHAVDEVHALINGQDSENPSWTVKAVAIAEWESNPFRTIEEVRKVLLK